MMLVQTVGCGHYHPIIFPNAALRLAQRPKVQFRLKQPVVQPRGGPQLTVIRQRVFPWDTNPWFKKIHKKKMCISYKRSHSQRKNNIW